ncbi:MAG: hypothetical protein QOJ93_2449 [Actinomycetota bacterium]|nr:hypothetical protein [Actinomycetota bacterium]
MASVRTCLLAATAATAALFVTLAAPPVEAQLIPFPTPLLPGLVGPSPSAAPAPAAPAASAPAKAPAPGARAKPSGNAPANAPQNTRASSSSKKSPSVQAATSAGSGPARAPSFIRTGPASTAGLITDIAPLVGDGMASRDALILAGPPFPVAGMAKYSDDFLTPRLTPVPHLHQGTDVFADFGTPIVASGPGRVTQRDYAPDAGGLEIWVAGDDGVNYYYAHLLSFSEAAQVGRTVTAGTILGYVGNTGDASEGPPHLHFEIHPPGSGRDKVLAAGVPITGIVASSSGSINPKPVLDAWLAQAEQHAIAMTAKSAAKSGLPDAPPDLTLSGRSGKPAELVWFSVFQPSLGSLGLALQAANAAGTVDEKATSSEAASADVQRRAEIGLAVRTPYVHLGELAGNGSGSAMDQLIGAGSP